MSDAIGAPVTAPTNPAQPQHATVEAESSPVVVAWGLSTESTDALRSLETATARWSK